MVLCFCEISQWQFKSNESFMVTFNLVEIPEHLSSSINPQWTLRTSRLEDMSENLCTQVLREMSFGFLPYLLIYNGDFL